MPQTLHTHSCYVWSTTISMHGKQTFPGTAISTCYRHVSTIPPISCSFSGLSQSSSSHRDLQINIMNTTTAATSTIADISLKIIRGASSAARTTLSRFSYYQVPHIKIKAEHQALLLFHILKIAFTYWASWRDGSRNKEEGEGANNRGKDGKRRRGRKVVGKGKYTVVFQ